MTPIILVAAFLAQDAATFSFTEREGGTFPGTLQGREKVEIDLRPIPEGTEVYRATFHPGRDESEAFAARDRAVKWTVTGSDKPLVLLGPRFTSFDVTDAVKAALSRRKVSFTRVEFPGYRPLSNRLDITCSAKSRVAIPRVTGLTARHRAGQTILTWTEAESDEVTFHGWRERANQPPSSIRYRIYRSEAPFTRGGFEKVELVDEVGPGTGWNPDFYGVSPRDTAYVPRYVVDEGKPPVAPGSGVYAHNPRKPGKAYYAVSRVLEGQEDLSTFDSGNATQEPIEEQVGPGEPVLQRIEKPKSFSYVEAPTLHYYVRWESAPRSNIPSRPFDYLVAIPPKKVDPSPVGLHLHCWGGSLEGGYGWWYDAAQGAVLVATNEIPYDWWTGYHEYSGTWRSWKEGVVRDYTQTRVLAFLDWAGTKWSLDRSRVFTAGNSMGGSGSPNFALRRASQIAWAVSWVGVHTPARSPQFKGSYERVYGNVEWKLPYLDGKTAAFDYFDDARFVSDRRALDAPLLCFANGKNDGAIGWPQARDFWKALQDARQPHVFVWGQGGHGQRALLPGPIPNERELGIDVRIDRTLPAFTHCSLDGNPGNGDPKDGDAQGQSNLYLYWEGADSAITDEETRWSMALHLGGGAPKAECSVDVTPRRSRKFKPAAGARIGWKSLSIADGKDIQSGEVTPDESGLVTIPKVTVTKGGNRLTLEVTK